MDRNEWFKPKWKWLKRFTLTALAGVLLLCLAPVLGNTPLGIITVILAILTFVPLIFWICFIPIMHWKDRYGGTHPNTWGAFLVFETSGWSKLFYWFMHVLPDYSGTGLYTKNPQADR